MKIPVGIVGVTGYSGQELLRILLRHPTISVRYLASLRLSRAMPLGELLPAFRDGPAASIEPFRAGRAMAQCETIFLALPNGHAMKLAPALLRRASLRIVDLSGDFRLKSSGLFRKAYGLAHVSPNLLRQAEYGLSELNRERIAEARVVANPGCYPTAALLALAPLAEAGLLKPKGLVVDAKSGVTGAGRSLREDLLFPEVHEDLRAYKVDGHPHLPEMEQELHRLAGKPVALSFVPHLVPMNRGLYATVYAPVRKTLTEKAARSLLEERYGSEPFVRLLPPGVWPQVKSVAGTNRCDIGLRVEPGGRRWILLSAIDNLGKGAAGQAVQNMNLLLGLPETAGLLPAEG